MRYATARRGRPGRPPLDPLDGQSDLPSRAPAGEFHCSRLGTALRPRVRARSRLQADTVCIAGPKPLGGDVFVVNPTPHL